MNTAPTETKANVGGWLLACLVGVTLAVGVWWPLVNGAGLLGGDTYSYFIPQKQLYAQQLKAGTLPLWHDRTGFGYPALAESQTAVFYPPNVVLYSMLDVNTAYSWNVILHYALAFVFCWRLAVASRISTVPALFVALIFVYGWFPARVSLEWAIIGGAWFPAAIWLTRDHLMRPNSVRMFALALVLALQLLAGHFTLAFITLVIVGTMVAIAAFRGLSTSRNQSPDSAVTEARTGQLPGWSMAAIALVAAYLLAGPQLLPTYELKQRSQRDGATVYHDPGYGHMPPLYLSQLALSWSYWHSQEVVQAQSFKQLPASIDSGTNKVEAHFYVGILPLALIIYGLIAPHLRRRLPGWLLRFWIPAGILATVYATGWLIPVAKHLPGFGYFIGPGRWTIVGTMALALLAGSVVDVMLVRRGFVARIVIVAALAALTIPDLLASAKYIADAFPVESPPIELVEQSWIRQRLQEEPGPVRVFAPGQNLGNLLGVSTYPVYLGLAPAEYYDPDLMFPPGADAGGPLPSSGEEFSEEQFDWLIRCGVTHVLSEQPIASESGRLQLIGNQVDSLYARAWGSPNPMFLYRVAGAIGRASSDPEDALSAIQVEADSPQRVTVSVHAARECFVILRDLQYPGWTVTVDGAAAEVVTHDKMFRAVRVPAGTHTVVWSYRPKSLWSGVALAGIGIVLLVAITMTNRRRSIIVDG